MSEAKESLERYLILREGIYGDDWFSNMDYSRPHIDEMLDKGLIVVYPKKDNLGRTILLSRFAAVDPKISNIANEACSIATMHLETLIDDEENQIRGLVYVFDVSDIKLMHLFIFPITKWFKFGKNAEVMIEIQK